MNDDPLAPARGCLYGVLGGALLWLLLTAIGWLVTR